MTDVSHELGALRFVVDSPLSSKVAMFNNQATQHKQSQLLNPFSHDGRASSPKPTFSKDQYGKPLAGSLTEMRGQKANMHVMKEMLELCQIIDSEGYQVKDEPSMRVIPFGELFNIYNYISDKVVGILLRARKHKLLEFEGEMLYQRRDDDVPIFLLRPIVEIRRELTDKIEEIKRGASPAPQSTSVMLDRAAHENNLKVRQEEQRLSKSRTPSPAMKGKSKSKSPSPAVADKPATAATATATAPAATNPAVATKSETPIVVVDQPPVAQPAAEPAVEPVAKPVAEPVAEPAAEIAADVTTAPAATATEQVQPASESQPEPVPAITMPETVAAAAPTATANPADAAPTDAAAPAAAAPADNASPADAVPTGQHTDDLPTIVIEASATFVRTVSVEQLPVEQLETAAGTAESV